MFNRGIKQMIKEAAFQGLFWIVTLILFGLIVLKMIMYVNG